jgi:hypothetical protein
VLAVSNWRTDSASKPTPTTNKTGCPLIWPIGMVPTLPFISVLATRSDERGRPTSRAKTFAVPMGTMPKGTGVPRQSPLGLTLLGPDGLDPSFRAPRVEENVNEKIWAVAFGLTFVGLIEA